KKPASRTFVISKIPVVGGPFGQGIIGVVVPRIPRCDEFYILGDAIWGISAFAKAQMVAKR
ncbi:hypothetical protein OAC63_05780, partial [Amylibacter sp.]|nr:hypothetical protein [Amylibacter sp.]